MSSALGESTAARPTSTPPLVPKSASPAAAGRRRTVSLRRVGLTGALWTGVGFAGSQFVRLVSNIILTRLVAPEAFGVLALINVFMQGLAMFSDLGLGPSVVQHERGEEPEFYDTAWTIQVFRGAILWVASMILAWPVAVLYHEPQLLWLVPVGGLSAIIAGFTSTSLYSLTRRMQFKRSTLYDLGTALVSTGVTIVWVWASPTAWSMTCALVAGAGIRMAASWLLCADVRNRFRWDPEAAKSLIRFGKWVFLSTLITFFANQLDRMLLGRVGSMATLGIYSAALSLVLVPQQIVARVFSTTAFPILTELARRDRGSMNAKLHEIRRAALPLCVLATVGAVAVAPLFFRILYDARYQDAGRIAQLLAVYVWFIYLQGTADRALLAVGDSQALAISSLINVVVTFIGCIIGARLGGIQGFILGLSASSLAGHITVLAALSRHRIYLFRQDCAFTAITAAAAAMATGFPWLVGWMQWPGVTIATWSVPVAVLGVIGIWCLNGIRSISK